MGHTGALLDERARGMAPARLRTTITGGFALLGVVSLALWNRPPNSFARGHWLFTYEDGTWSRGLVGTIFQAAGGSVDHHVTPVAIIMYLAAVTAVAWTAGHLIVVNGRVHRTRLTLALTVALSPAGFPFLAGSLGRFDTLLVTFAVCAIAIVSRCRGRRRWGALVAILLLAIAVHEAALLLVAVWVSAYYARQLVTEGARLTEAAVVAGSVLTVCVAVTLAIGTHQPPLPYQELTGRYAATLGEWGEPTARIQYASVVDNALVTRGWLASPLGSNLLRWDLALAVPLFGACAAVLSRSRRMPPEDGLLMLACAAPLALAVIGADLGRWIAFAVLLSAPTAMLVSSRYPTQRPPRLLAGLLVILSGWTLLSGGIHHHAVPWGREPYSAAAPVVHGVP